MVDRRIQEVKIARFIGIEACKSVFSENSTFVLRSPEHYRRLYAITAGANAKADRDEGIAEKIDGGHAEFTGYLASCWTMLEGNQPTLDEWNIFKEDEQNIVAIVSTPTLVCEFLKTALQIDRDPGQRRWPFLSLEHGKVCYEKRDIDRTTMFDIVPFTKNGRFKKEKEYRFVLKYAQSPIIDSLIFCAGYDYMERRDDGRLTNFANPRMSDQNKKGLRRILLKAFGGYADFAGGQAYRIADLRNGVRQQICEIIANGEILL